jgi:Ca-activated chloride channel family protein
VSRTLIVALGLAVVARPLCAQGWIEVEPLPHSAGVPTVARIGSAVRTTIDGRVARVEVEEQFRNTGGGLAEGSYLYPLPGEAVFQNFSLWMGGQEIRGEMMNADQARGIYEEIVRRKRDPALLTLAGHGLVRAQVFPIQAGEIRKIALRYTQLLERAGDALRVRYALGDRGAAPFSYVVDVPDADSYGTPYSPTHPVTSKRTGDHLEVTVNAENGGDIDLFLPLRRGVVGMSAVAHAPGGEDGYFMLLLAPALNQSGPVIPRDISFVVDVSGSMSGDKLDQAKAALHQALGTLQPVDRFRLVAFSSGVRNFRDGWAPVTSGTLAEAGRFVDALQAEGGTNIAGALDQVLGSAVPEDRLPIVVFLTDGVPSVGEQDPDRIAASAAGRIGRTRVFTVGVGQDVNTYLIDRLAKEGRGSAQYVAAGSSVEVAMGTLLGKIRRPALVNLRLAAAPVGLTEMSPAMLPDLFYGEELVVFGRYHGTGVGQVVIEGERNGRRERFSTAASFPETEPANDFVPRLWAARRIGDMTRQARLEGSSDTLIGEIRDLGLRYGILTEYTSYLVQEPNVVAVGQPLEDRVPMRAGGFATPPPSAQTGVAAFDRAKESAQLTKTSSLAEADGAADEKLESLGSSTADVRRAGGRLFLKRAGVWTDAALHDSVRIVEITAYSDAYFALVRGLPEIGPCLALGEDIVIAGRGVTLHIGSRGVSNLSAKELSAVVKDFRGA